MKTVLVTGGAGYIGNILIRKLLDNNYKVKIVDRFFFVDDKVLPNNQNLSINTGLCFKKHDQIQNHIFLLYLLTPYIILILVL